MRPVPARREKIVLSVLSLQHTNGEDAPANRIKMRLLERINPGNHVVRPAGGGETEASGRNG